MQVSIKELKITYGSFSLDLGHLNLKQGESLLIKGESGTGKSSFLKVLAGISKAEHGSISLGDQVLSEMNDDELRAFRLNRIAYISHDTELLPSLSLIDNILLPIILNPKINVNDSTKKYAEELINKTGLQHLSTSDVNTLSKGEKQRLAICRALIKNPDLILADEPFSNLDSKNLDIVKDLLFSYHKESNCSLIVVSHKVMLENLFDKVLAFPGEEMTS